MRKLLLLRPQPGMMASAERARALGLDVSLCSLFRVEPLSWQAPDPARFDALLITSSNALRHGGPPLETVKALPVQAVGTATADFARQSGFTVAGVGEGNVAELLRTLPTDMRLLHLAGETYRMPDDPRIERRIVYRSIAIAEPQLPPLDQLVVAVHSPRAAQRLAALATDRCTTSIAAISDAAAEACGAGWERIEVASRPDDESLLALAARLCQTSSPT